MHADLHTHSSASDGQHSPAQLVRMAAAQGIPVLALTDHDTIDGIPEALAAGTDCGIRVLPGVELSAREYKNFHILGYGFQVHPEGPLSRLCEWMKQGRDERKFRILDFLREKGLELRLEEVEKFAGGGVIARPHFARALVQRGYADSVQEAFDRWLDTPEYARIKRPKPDARTCIDTIHASGGKAVLAHPYQLRMDSGSLSGLIARLAEYGLDGLECHYPKHSPEQTAFYLELARRFGLHPTGGSDFHGEAVKPNIHLTAYEQDLRWLEDR